MPDWTSAQKQVIDARNCDLLVTAAAGSGKTAVLVERILSLISDPDEPVNIDELLVVTFTEAAASEMKERLLSSLMKMEAEGEMAGHIARQRTLIHSASISTIHSFCLSVIRDHFQKIDLDPSFRVPDSGESALLEQEVLDELLESWYSGEGEQEGIDAPDPERFIELADALETGRQDDHIETCLRSLLREAVGHEDPRTWLMSLPDLADQMAKEDGPLFDEMAKETKRALLAEAEYLENLADECLSKGAPYPYRSRILEDADMLRSLCKDRDYESWKECLPGLSFPSLPPVSQKKMEAEGIDARKKDRIQKLRNKVKDRIKTLRADFFDKENEEMLSEQALAAGQIRLLSELAVRFYDAFQRKKRDRNVLDYADMEHLALEILSERDGDALVPSPAAASYRERFREVMVDEYQDSSFVQEAILSLVSGGRNHPHNRFIVGDVKQSIYGFRQSRPELFLEKYYLYQKDESADRRRIDLDCNFRSRQIVIDSVNAVFERLMTPENGGIDYRDGNELVRAASYPEKEEGRTQICILTQDEEKRKKEGASRQETEAEKVADLVKTILERDMVTDGVTKQLRRVTYGDIAVLTRKGVRWVDALSAACRKRGIPAVADSRSGFFDAEEIALILHLLRLIDNPHQDIPLLAVLHSPIAGLSGEDLAAIRISYPKEPFCRAVRLYADEREGELSDALTSFFEWLSDLRQRIRFTPIHRLIEEILKESSYGLYVQAMPGGRQKKANLDYLVKKAAAYEGTGAHGLFRFLRYLELLKEQNEDPGEVNSAEGAEDAVKVMTIHKSKGLEFPVVILAGLGEKSSSRSDGGLYLDSTLGAALNPVDPKTRLRASTASYSILKRRKNRAEEAEENRILYVAMTRAREELYLIGSTEDSGEIGEGSPLARILKAAVNRPEFFEISRIWETDDTESDRKTESLFPSEAEVRKLISAIDAQTVYDRTLAESVNWEFSSGLFAEKERGKPVKLSVSELKRMAGEEEADEEKLYRDEVPVPLIPQFIEKASEGTGAIRGTAHHRFLEHYDYRANPGAEQALLDLIERGIFTEESGKLLSLDALDVFLAGPLAARMKRADEKGLLKREQPFVIGVPDGDDILLVQGMIDAFFEEDGCMVLVDYKTDRVSTEEELVDHYKVQLDYYRKALEQLTHRSVKEEIIYSLHLGREIRL